MEKLENVINQVLILELSFDKINWHQKKNNYNVNILYIIKLLKIDISYFSLF